MNTGQELRAWFLRATRRGIFQKATTLRRPVARRPFRIDALEPRTMLCGESALLGAAFSATIADDGLGVEAALIGVSRIAARAKPMVSVGVTDPAATETLAGQTADSGLLTISRTGATAKALTVKFTISGTAANGTDYARIGTSVVIAAGQSSAAVSIVPLDDMDIESSETVTLDLAKRSAYKLDATELTATVAIGDNDFPDAMIASIVGEVQRTNGTPAVDSYEEFFSQLPVNEGSQRGYVQEAPQPDLLAARATIFAELGRALGPAGGSVIYQDFTVGGYAGRNIVGVLPGQGPNSSRQYVISAHYDSEQNAGADDDGSGVAAVLQAASVLAKHTFDSTLVFVAFDQEEYRSNGWGRGSQFFAASAEASGSDIRGAVVLDMIAFNGGDNVAVVGQSDSSSRSPSAELANGIVRAIETYTALTAQQMTGFDDTDGYRLYQAGFAAATVIEQLDSRGDLLNPYYHEESDFYLNASGQPQTYDGRGYLDFVYATEMTKGVVAWAATAATVL